MSGPTIKPRRKRSAVWRIEKIALEATVKNATSLNQVLMSFGLDNRSASYVSLKARLQFDGIDYSHIALGLGHNKGKRSSRKSSPLEDILVIDSTLNRSNLKKRLIKEGLLENKCAICGQLPEWNGKPLSLQIDHINGVCNDNRIENLRILCPHCHSQTDTFGGRRHKKDSPPSPSQINPDWRNSPRPATRKVERPTKEVLGQLIWEKPATQLAEYFEVSDNAVRKWAKGYGLALPPRHHWQKKNAA